MKLKCRLIIKSDGTFFTYLIRKKSFVFNLVLMIVTKDIRLLHTEKMAKKRHGLV